jgi:predicted component of type VI protein secretion system
MAIAELYSGSQTATISTEHVLNSPTPNTTDGIFQVFIDVSAMVAADVLELRIKEKCRAADTIRQVLMSTLAGVQSDPLWVSPSLILMHGWDVTLKQTAGTGRAFPWSIRQVA